MRVPVTGVTAVTALLLSTLSKSSVLAIPVEQRDVAVVDVSERTVSASTTAYDSILGPVVPVNFPDPAILYYNGLSYAFATTNRGIGPYGMINIQVATSSDNQTWTVIEGHDALPVVPSWQLDNGTWAPDVVQLADGTFVMYYAGSLKSDVHHHCIGVATSKTVTGPYTALEQPFACPDILTLGGAIDPEGFLDPSTGKRYVLYKVDGNSIGHGGICRNTVAPLVPTPIMLQEVDVNDGLTLIGAAEEILDRDAEDGPLIEAPAMHRTAEGVYFLFYSSNCFTTPFYNTLYATATNIGGPYTKQRIPLFSTGTGPQLVAPGGTDIIKDGTLIVFHGRVNASNIAGDMDRVKHDKSADGSSKEKRVGLPPREPLIRGMYTANAVFSGTTVDLSGPIPGT